MRYLALGLAVLMLAPLVAYAQTDEEIFEEFQFNFATPGARAAAMGRAFIGLADDATAAETNPAGLVILTKPEASFEIKRTDYTVERAAGYNSLSDGTTTDFGQAITSPSFLSFVYPVGRLRFAFFRQEFLNYEESFALGLRKIPDSGTEFLPSTGEVDFLGANWGGAVAYQLSPKAFAGFSVKYSQLKADTKTAKFSGTVLQDRSSISDTQSGLSFTVGFLANPSRKLSIGAIYERNPQFDYTEHYEAFLIPPTKKDYAVTIKIPDRFGFGAAVRPTESLTVLADVQVIQYSQIAEKTTLILFADKGLSPSDFDIDNATEFHVGAEYMFFVGDTALAVRGGTFTNPSHDLRYVGDKTSVWGHVADELFNFGEEDTAIGYTVGGGVVLASRVQIDVAYLISDPFNEFSASFVVRF
ncbi:MAG: outer membrane protein transport protein [Acidobacteriota bacterium]